MTEEQDIPSRNLTSRRNLRVVLPSVAVIGIMLGLVAYSLSETPQDEFDQRVHDYLMAHPEVIMESVNRLEASAREKAETDIQMVLQARADEVFRDPDSPTSGNPNGDVTLVEFFDYNCPYCRQVAPVVTKAQQADSQLRVVYKEFPILGPNSTVAAKAALAAHKQGKYVEFHRALYQLRGAVDDSKAMEAAAAVGLDIERLKTDMEDSKIQASIQKNLALAQALRINGTPGFVIGDQILRGATDLNTLQTWIRTARERRQ
ncbi:protein-disulfide isomerase [Bradyrhizobium sp. AZCC 1578]|uniref:DsbA family protein n=1 Tax=Bradyrhizobium sp. AZCC 1578 TaxID=3117027 RepID=UPI002FEF05F1